MMTDSRACIAILLCPFLAAGCATPKTPAIYTPPVGSHVKVIQDLKTEEGARVFVQDGKVLQHEDIAFSSPYCQFSLYRSREEMRDPILIRRGVFTVTRAYKQQDWSWAEGLQFAGDTSRSMSTVMDLSSDDQPEVRHLVCSRWGSWSIGGWVTVAEMQSTLNGLAEIVLAE